MNTASYCRRWNFDWHEPIDPLEPQQAAARGERGQLYTVVLPDAEGGKVPRAVIEVEWANDHAAVWFFDEHGRQALNYLFRRTDGDVLFLHNMCEWAYPDDEAETLAGAVRIEEIRFAENGVVKQIVSDDVLQARETVDISDVDVSSHWEPLPTLGEWDSLARWDRTSS